LDGLIGVTTTEKFLEEFADTLNVKLNN